MTLSLFRALLFAQTVLFKATKNIKILALPFLLLSGLSLAESLTLQVDRIQVSLGESFQAELSYNGDKQSQTPDFSILDKHFNVLRVVPTVSRFEVNGEVSRSTKWSLELEPKIKGRLLIPPFVVNGQTSSAVEIEVKNAQAAPTNGNSDIFLETLVDKSSTYVQEQVRVTYRLNYAIDIEQLNAEELTIDDAIIKQLPAKRYRRKSGNKQYNVYEVSFAILPQQSGTLVIPRLTWQLGILKSGQQRSLYSRFGRIENRRLRTQEKMLRIKAIPSTFPKTAQWLPASKLVIAEQWSADTSALQIGEPITRSIRLQATGVESAQLPTVLKEIVANNLKIYKEKPVFSDNENDMGLLSERQESAAIVISSQQAVTLPAVSVPWWNTNTDELEFAKLPELTLQAEALSPTLTTKPILGPSQPALSTEVPGQSLEPSVKPYLAPLLMTLLLVTNVLWAFLLFYVKHNSSPKSLNSQSDNKNVKSDLWHSLSTAIRNKDPLKVYDSLTQWINDSMSLANISMLIQSADQLKLTELSTNLQALQAQLYDKNQAGEACQFNLLEQQLKDFKNTENKPRSKAGLAEFYP